MECHCFLLRKCLFGMAIVKHFIPIAWARYEQHCVLLPAKWVVAQASQCNNRRQLDAVRTLDFSFKRADVQ